MPGPNAQIDALPEQDLSFATATEATIESFRSDTPYDTAIDTPSSKAPAKAFSKKFFDVILAIILIFFFAPLLLIISAIVKLDGGPAFFGHTRIGEDGKPFRCWKFRSMTVHADVVLAKLLATDAEARAEWAKDFKLRNDPRITRIGGFLRKSSLDELPQLFNVLKGEMSLVGPRPIVSAEVDRYGTAFVDYVACRPGITGLWQVSGRNDVDYASRVALDKHYAQTWSFARDVNILFRTVIVVARRSGAY
jgi:Undecaprenyl-phosphate galactose phosphotransferase WbaP